MKKTIIVPMAVAVFAMLGTIDAVAQAEMTAIGASATHSARGSARYQALSGAMGAVGTDFSSLHQNPAGIALFRSGNRISATLSHESSTNRSTWFGNSLLDKASKVHFDQLNYMTSWNTDGGKNITFALGIQNNGRFNRTMQAYARGLNPSGGFSLADYTAAILSGNGKDAPLPPSVLTGSSAFSSAAPWLGVLGYNSGWVDYVEGANGRRSYDSNYGWGGLNEGPRDASLIMKERGGVTNFDAGLGVRLSPEISLGFMLSMLTFEYGISSYYQEGFRSLPADASKSFGLSLDNRLDIAGSGFRFGVGVILEPVDALRIGASIYTPILYDMKISHYARTTGLTPKFLDKGALDVQTPEVAASSFGMNTPWRFTLNGAYVLGHTAIFSADYEYEMFNTTRLRSSWTDDHEYDENPYRWDNEAISEDFKGRHTLRMGLEVNATKRLALRGGVRYQTKISTETDLDRDVPKLEARVAGTLVHYRLPGAQVGLSLGLGYRLSPDWTIDLAYQHTLQTDRVQAVPYARNHVTNLEVKPIAAIHERYSRGLLSATISYRF